MSDKQKRPGVVWSVALFAMLCCFQVVAIAAWYDICIYVFEGSPSLRNYATLLGVPVAMVAGIVCALAVGRQIRWLTSSTCQFEVKLWAATHWSGLIDLPHDFFDLFSQRAW